MKSHKSIPLTILENEKRLKERSTTATMQSSQLRKLFEDELKDLYWAEKALTKAIPKMIKGATFHKLIHALTSHLAETKNHVSRMEAAQEKA
jgi:ferritin-like metal-binding protein YciE